MKKPRLVIDAERIEVFADGKRVHLSPREYKILTFLRTSKKAATREQLADEVMGSERAMDIDLRTLDQHVSRLRKNFKFPVIETVAGHGYRIVAGL